jgi:DNA primase
VIDYHQRAAGTQLPHRGGQPANLRRCSDGIDACLTAAESLRTLVGASVSASPEWNELDSRLLPDRSNLTNIFRRRGQRDDAFGAIDRRGVDIDPARLAQLQD